MRSRCSAACARADPRQPGGAAAAAPAADRDRRSPPTDPQPIVAAARTTAPHDRLTEWWYYTGHLARRDGARYGFEFVIFRAERGALPGQLGVAPRVTDEARRRVPLRPAAARSGRRSIDRRCGPTATPTGFDLGDLAAPTRRDRRDLRRATGLDDDRAATGDDRLPRRSAPDEAAAAGAPGGLGLDLALDATKPPALHDGDGWIDFGPAGGSYYYSRTRDGRAPAR